MAVQEFLNALDGETGSRLGDAVEVLPSTGGFPDPSKLPLDNPRWQTYSDVVVVAADLKNSTVISYSKQDRVGARLYEASTRGSVECVREFNPSFVDIQGDGLFAIFHGELAHERAIACAFTLKSFSTRSLGPRLRDYVGEDIPKLSESGLKIGVADGTLLARRIGVRGDHNEPVWAGRPVNFAMKCASSADRHDIVITAQVFDALKDNDYVAFSCGCRGEGEPISPGPLWREHEVESLRDHSAAYIFPGESSWCVTHGDSFYDAILRGANQRAEVDRDALELLRPADVEPPDATSNVANS